MNNHMTAFRRWFRVLIITVLLVCLLCQTVAAAVYPHVSSEFDFGLIFQNQYEADTEDSILNDTAFTANMSGSGSITEMKDLLTSESSYNSVKASLPYSFSIFYSFYGTGRITAALQIEGTEALKEAKDAAKRVFDSIISPDMTDLEKVKSIHDYLVLNCEYDYEAISSDDFEPYSYYGVFINKKAVCSGYADAFLLLCDMAGIPALVVCGEADSGTQILPHAWNMVCLDGVWYYVDVTYDDPYPNRPGTVLHDYYLVDYEFISSDHSFDEPFYFTLAEYLTRASEQSAARLNRLGLFKGTGDDFDLDRTPTRAESAVMLVRLLGAENEATDPANGYVKVTPFTDLPDWAAGHIGYLYANGITKGMSDTLYGSDSPVTMNQYLTFILRCLNYSEGDDFNWSEADKTALSIGLITEHKADAVASRGFLRADMADISAASLSQDYKGSPISLIGLLEVAGVLTREMAAANGYGSYLSD